MCSINVQGYNRVAVSAALNMGQCLIEIVGSYAVLLGPATEGRLAALGWVSLACAALTAVIGAASRLPVSTMHTCLKGGVPGVTGSRCMQPGCAACVRQAASALRH